jgi:hypothetical protein
MINESCHLSSKVEIMVSICLIASYKYKKHAIFLSCFGDFSDSSYFLPGLFRILGWVWGAVFGISAFSATFSCSFLDFGLGLRCCFGDFCGFSYFFLLFSGFLVGFGVLFCGFLRFQLLFPALTRIFGGVWGAVWGISAVSATFSCFFPASWAGFGCCFGNFCGFSSTKPACYAINLWLLYIMIIEKSSIF